MASIDQQTTRFLAAWMQLRQIVQASNFNQFRRAGLSASQFMTLNVVPAEGLTLTELARKLNLSPASLKITVDSLEERGLLTRRAHATDARKLTLLSTPAGRKLQNAISGDFHRFVADMFKAMPAGERNGLLTGLERMVQLGSRDQSAATDPSTRRGAGALPAPRSSRRSPPP